MTNEEQTNLIADLMARANNLSIADLIYLKGVADGLAKRKEEENAEN